MIDDYLEVLRENEGVVLIQYAYDCIQAIAEGRALLEKGVEEGDDVWISPHVSTKAKMCRDQHYFRFFLGFERTHPLFLRSAHRFLICYDQGEWQIHTMVLIGEEYEVVNLEESTMMKQMKEWVVSIAEEKSQGVTPEETLTLLEGPYMKARLRNEVN